MSTSHAPASSDPDRALAQLRPGTGAAGPQLVDLADALDRLAEVDPAALPPADGLRQARRLSELVTRARAILLTRLADVEARALWAQTGEACSTHGWVRAHELQVEPGDVALARRMSRMPDVAEAVRATACDTRSDTGADTGADTGPGRPPVAAVALVARAVARVHPFVDRFDGAIDGQPGDAVVRGVVWAGVRTLVAEHLGGLEDDDPRLDRLRVELERCLTATTQLSRLEAGFLVAASWIDATALPSALALLTDALLPAQHHDRAARSHARRALRLDRCFDGSGWRVDGHLTDSAGELLCTALDSELTRDAEAPADTARGEQVRAGGDEPYDAAVDRRPAGWPRSRAQRLHDALEAACRRYLGADLAGVADKAPVGLAVTVGADRLDQLPGALPARGPSGNPLAPSLLAELVCDSSLTRFVLSLGGRVREASHTARTLTAAERRVLHLEAGRRCQVRGCGRGHHRPGTSLVPHHVVPWASSRATGLRDTALLCGPCHHDLHLGRVGLTLRSRRRFDHQGWLDPP